jgi:hypothetical protein
MSSGLRHTLLRKSSERAVFKNPLSNRVPLIIECYLAVKVKLSSYCHAGTKGEKGYNSSVLTLALDGGE